MEELPTKKPKKYLYWVSLLALLGGLILTARFPGKVPIYVPVVLLIGCLVIHFLNRDHGHTH